MKERLLSFIKYYLYWVVFFVAQKPLFMLWQHNLIGNASWQDWFLVPWHGLPLDLSVAGYITLVFGLLLCVSCWAPAKVVKAITHIYTGIILAIALITIIGDNGCYPSWGYHIDKDIFDYLQSPNEVLACAPWWLWCLGGVLFAALYALWWVIYRRLFRSQPQPIEGVWHKTGSTVALFVLTALLFLPIRGSVTVSTMNTGRVYYSENRVLNLAAVNPVFNIVESLSENTLNTERYHYMSDEQCQTYFSQLHPATDSIPHYEDPLFTTQRPHIVLCILESFSANALPAMTNMQRFTQEGVYFNNLYANSYRTDRGVMAVLSAFPGCATTSVMTIPSVSQRLPQIGQVLKQNGYDLKFYYGGDEDFTNMRSYLVDGGFEQRVSDHDFPISQRLSKWGVPDHILFDFAATDIRERQSGATPCFDVILSLSSHEPFEVNYHHLEHPYLNAIAYSDSCLGAFVDSLRNDPSWENTVVVMVADHGFPYPDGIQNYDTLRYKIPLVMVGGAIRHPRTVSTLASQIDWVPTLLHQMGLDASEFVFAKDILAPTTVPFAYYNFVDGFALLDTTGAVIIDAAVNQPIMELNASTERTLQAQAVTQTIMQTLTAK